MTPNRSSFVTALAWIFIVLAGFATVIAILQNIMLAVMFPAEEMRAAFKESEKAQPIPGVFRFMFENFRFFFAAFLVLSAATLISAIGLLRRYNWARITFIVIMACGVVWNLGSPVILFVMTSMFPDVPSDAGRRFDDDFKLMWNIMAVFAVVISLVFAALFAWIIKRLLSDDIRSEFLVRNSPQG